MRFLLYPFSILYGFIISIRNFLYDFHVLEVKEFDLPVVCVGNITVGGTGKTPHVEYLVNFLQESYKITVLSRGYGRRTKSYLEVQENMTAIQVGDEPLQVKVKYPDINVVVDAKRVRGIENILTKHEDTQVIILDDGFQHRNVKPGIAIVLVDYNRLITKDFLLPYGRLRESAKQIKRADIIIVTKCPDDLSPIDRRILYKDFHTYAYQNLFFTTTKYENLKHIETGKIIELNDSNLKESDVLLVTGIANSKYLVSFSNDLFNKIIHKKFADHYAYKVLDLNNIIKDFQNIPGENKIILTTEKDAVRMRQCENYETLVQYPVYYLPIHVHFLNEDSENFNKIIEQYVATNKKRMTI